MRRKIAVLGSLSVVLLASAGTLPPADGPMPPPSRVGTNSLEDANRRGRIIAALQDGFPPALVRGLDDLVRDGQIPAGLVTQAKADAEKNHSVSLLRQIRVGIRDPRKEDPLIREALRSGVITEESVNTAWREGCAERAQALVDSLRAPVTPVSALHEFEEASVADQIESVLRDADWSAEAIADARMVWKDHRSRQTLALLDFAIYVPNWLDQLHWGLERAVFSADEVAEALATADRVETATVWE